MVVFCALASYTSKFSDAIRGWLRLFVSQAQKRGRTSETLIVDASIKIPFLRFLGVSETSMTCMVYFCALPQGIKFEEDGVDGVRHEFAQLGLSRRATNIVAERLQLCHPRSCFLLLGKWQASRHHVLPGLGWWINAPAHPWETSSVVHCNSFGDQSWCKVRKDQRKLAYRFR